MNYYNSITYLLVFLFTLLKVLFVSHHLKSKLSSNIKVYDYNKIFNSNISTKSTFSRLSRFLKCISRF